MDYKEIQNVCDKLLDYYSTKQGERYKYACAFGVVSSMLTSEQAETLDRYLDKWIEESETK